MKVISSHLILSLILSAIFSLSTLAAGVDANGVDDHGLIGRYPGTYISQQTASEFDASIIPLDTTDFLQW